MKTVKLHRTAQGWMAQFVDDPEIEALFGTDTIPTAFTSQVDADRVLEKIKALNPDYTVVV